MALSVVEVFGTVQGEGTQVGTPAVFVRLGGCNLWAGTEATREAGRGDCAFWCDTVFTGGKRMEVRHLLDRIGEIAEDWADPLVVLTGGEPMLQLSKPSGQELVEKLVDIGYRVAVETNGTVRVDFGGLPVHVTVSPKGMAGEPNRWDHVIQRTGDALKVVVPCPIPLEELDEWHFTERYLQPMDLGDGHVDHLDECIATAARMGWKVSVQTHKLVGLA
jgi:organic radical activating enzyme